MNLQSNWSHLAAQQLVRYEALFGLLDDIQVLEDLGAIAQRIASQWKYFANVSSFRLVVAHEPGFLVIDGHRGQAQLGAVQQLSSWDAQHWATRLPHLVSLAHPPTGPALPDHLSAKGVVEVEVLPLVRRDSLVGVLSVAARHEPFNELDKRFISLFGRHFADRVTDLLLRQRNTEQLLEKARRDPLTGLYNRGAIVERLGGQLALARRTGQPLSVVMADIDLFKRINDEHGHEAGDVVLAEVARRLQACTREGDSLGRYGGEEFLFVLYPCGEDEAAASAERFRRAITDAGFSLTSDPPCTLHVSISLGTAGVASADAADPSTLLRRADQALYRSKHAGRNRVTAAGSQG